MDLLELSEKKVMKREAAADLLRQLADSLARHNAIDFNHNGIKVQARVPAEVTVELEYEAETEESSIEIEISW